MKPLLLALLLLLLYLSQRQKKVEMLPNFPEDWDGWA